MPAADHVLAGLKEIANTWQPLAVLWHVYVAVVVLLLLAGRRPSRRILGVLIALPLVSVSVLAGVSGNPFNALAFGLVGIAVLILSLGFSRHPVELSPQWAWMSGAVLVAFGWVYPHFLETSSSLMYLLAAPTGLIPCPTVSAVIGIALILNGLGSRALSLTLGVTGMFYGVVGVSRLGVAIDWFLVGGSVLMLLYAAIGNRSLAHDNAPKKFVDIPHFCEGVVFDAAGDFYVSDMMEGTIYRVTDDRTVIVWGRTKRPNGHKIMPDGTHLVCDAAEKAVLRLDAGGNVIGRVSSGWQGEPLLGPNDVTLDGIGGFYFTDPEGSGVLTPIGAVYYVDSAGVTHRVLHGLAYPNGLVVRPDGKTLLVGEGERNRILSYEILSPGKVGPARVLIDLPARSGKQIDNHPDGMTLDESGNLYIAHYGMGKIQVVSPDGRLVKSLDAGNLSCSNVAFAGRGMNQLYITGSLQEQQSPGAVFVIDLHGVRGLKSSRNGGI
jgi:gluconolactonase